MKKIFWLSFMLLLLLTTATASRACCFYNNASYPLKVLGPKVSGLGWIVHPSNQRCTDGTGGTFSLMMLGANEHTSISTAVDIRVDNHGWISVSPNQNGEWKATAKDKNGNFTDMEAMIGNPPGGAMKKPQTRRVAGTKSAPFRRRLPLSPAA